jgi:hypothetical protein
MKIQDISTEKGIMRNISNPEPNSPSSLSKTFNNPKGSNNMKIQQKRVLK